MMKRSIAAALRTRRLRALRSLAMRAEGSSGAPPALLGRWVRGREDRLFSALGGAMSFQLLRTAHVIGLFELLHRAPGLRAAEIADRLGLGEHPTEILLLGLTPMRLLE